MYLIEFIMAESQYSVKVAINLMMLVIILVAVVTENLHHLWWCQCIVPGKLELYSSNYK